MKGVSLKFLVMYFLLVNCDSKSSLRWNRTILPRIVNNVTVTPFDWSLTLKRTFLTSEQSGKLCLKNVDKCMEEDFNYDTTMGRLSNFMLARAPPFDLSRINRASFICRKQSAKYIQDLKKFKLWALKMYDSTAKFPSGILNGNTNQLGDFDMCLGANNHKINGQYCLASIQIDSSSSSSPYVLALHRLTQSHFHFKSQLDDPGHRVPRFSSVNWALCVPNGCTSRDVELGLRSNLKEIFEMTDLEVNVRVDDNMCQTKHQREIPMSTIVASSIFLGIILFEICATVYDYTTDENKNKWIMAFSLRKNFSSIISVKKSADDIEAIHAIRFLNAFILLLAHKSMALFFIPYVNRTEMVEYVSRPWTVLARAASLYTDPFIMFSGTLTAYSILGKLEKYGKINILEEYMSRLFRIVPTFAALIAFCTFVLPWLNSGPMWNLVISHHSEICKKYWWRNLLFIHNYFGFKDMCLTHTHHVGIDTQLFFVSPILILLLWKWSKKGAYTLTFLALISTIMRYYVTYTMKLSNYIHFGTSINQLFETADNMYILPIHRATVYIMGIFLGYTLRNYRQFPMTKSQHRMGNALALLSFAASFFGPAFMGSIDYVYNPRDAAWYAAFAPILWCFSFGWIIFTTHIGSNRFLERFFSWPLFSLWTKISYTVYLTQFPIFFYNVGITRNSEHYGFFKMTFNLREILWICFFSLILTLVFETPFQNIRNIIFKKKVEPVQKKIS